MILKSNTIYHIVIQVAESVAVLAAGVESAFPVILVAGDCVLKPAGTPIELIKTPLELFERSLTRARNVVVKLLLNIVAWFDDGFGLHDQASDYIDG